MQNVNLRPNIVMKTKILAVVMAAGFGWFAPAEQPARAEDVFLTGTGPVPFTVPILGNDYAPYASVETGAAYVKLSEWVFKEPGSDDKISAIDYNMGLNGGFRLGLGFEPYNKLKKTGMGISGMYASYFPVNGGFVSDSDWDDNGNLFSLGTATASSMAFTDVEGKLQLYIPLGKILALVVTAKLWYCRYAVAAHDGWIQQQDAGEPWNDALPKETLYGMSMMYIQEWLSIAPGLGLWVQSGRHSVSLFTSVWGGVWGYHLDYHYFKKTDPYDELERYVIYNDKVKGNLNINVEVEWKYRVKRYGELGVSIGYKGIPKARGSGSIMTAGLVDNVYHETDSAGAAITHIYGGVSYKLWL